MKIKTFLFLFFVSSIVFASDELILKPLSPFPLDDDTFVVTIDGRSDVPMFVKPWVKFMNDSWSTTPIREWYSSTIVDKSHKTELRLFLIKNDVSYNQVRTEIGKLLVMGYRPTTLRHLVAFSNNENARLLDPGVMIIVSSRPELRLDKDNFISINAFYAALTAKDGILVGIVMPKDMNLLPTRMLILEPPDFKL